MDDKTKKSLDDCVKDIQLQIVALRTQAYEPSEVQKEKINTYVYTINLINEHFETNYMDYGLVSIKLTGDNNMVLKGLISKLPLEKE